MPEPEWGDKSLWQDGIDAYTQGQAPESDVKVLLHRDFHPLNLLWDESGIVAVLDWVNACVGHPHAELSHCRWNLSLLADIETADRFLAHYLALTDHGHYAPWWDLSTALGFLPGPPGNEAWHAIGRTDLTTRKVIEASESFLRSALDRL